MGRIRAEIKEQLRALSGGKKPTERCGPNTIETTGPLFARYIQGSTLASHFTPDNDQEGRMGYIDVVDDDRKHIRYTIWVDLRAPVDIRSLNR